MRYVLLILAIFGVIVSSLALREHYNTGDSPCNINEKWDCGVVNKSVFAVIGGVPVAAIGIAGYILLGVLAWTRKYNLMRIAVAFALAFSLYLTHIEKDLLQVWCIYCVSSLVTISVMTLLLLGEGLAALKRRKANT